MQTLSSPQQRREALREKIRELHLVSGRPIKMVVIKVFEPGNQICRTRRCAALKGKHWTDDGIHRLLEFIATEIEQAMPGEEYELVELGRDRFNFVHRYGRSSPGVSA